MPRSSHSAFTQPRQGILVFLAINFALSSVFYALIIHAGTLSGLGGIYVSGLMWCPGVAAIITCWLRGQSLASLGWRWNGRYQLISYAIPIGYAVATYVVVWVTRLGGFPNREFLTAIGKSAGWSGMPTAVVLIGYVVLQGTIGMVGSTASGLGEEIGWRGFLVPELAKVTSFTNTALISGAIWATWHVPILLFADYNSGTPAWYGFTCFATMVIGISFVFAWLRLRSGSLWTAAILHGSHNLFIQGILTPLTTDTGRTEYMIDEFGAGLAVAAIIVAFLVWRRRHLVEGAARRSAADLLTTPNAA